MDELTEEELQFFYEDLRESINPKTLEDINFLVDFFKINALDILFKLFSDPQVDKIIKIVHKLLNLGRTESAFKNMTVDEILDDDEFKKQHSLTEEETKVAKKITEVILNPYPTSPATHNLNLMMNGMGSVRPTRVNRNTKLEDWTTETGEYTATFENNQGTTTIIFENVDDLVKRYDKSLKKIFAFLLQRANQTYFHEACFSLDELVEIGIYSNTDSARVGLNKAMKKLTSIKISGEVKKGKKVVKNGLHVLFTGYEIERGYCTVYINPKFNIPFIAQYFTLLPNWSYRLNNKAFSLIEYIFYLARQTANTKNLKEKGHFNIGFSAINDYLQQPTPKETKNHTRDIIDPILNAITEIEEAQEDTSFTFTPRYNFDYKNAVEFLKGYLQIEFTGEALEYFIARANDQEQEFKKVQKRKEKALLEIEKNKQEK